MNNDKWVNNNMAFKNSPISSSYSTSPSKYNSLMKSRLSLTSRPQPNSFKPYSPIIKLSDLR